MDGTLSRAPQRGRAEARVPAPGGFLSAVALLPLAAGYFLSYLFRNVNGVVAGDIMRDLGIGADALGLLTSAYFLTFAAAQLPVGVLLDRYGPRRVQSALLLCAAVGAGLCALDAGFTGLLFGRALIGLGTAGGLVAGLKASAQWFPRERLATINGAFIMCGGLGALAATWPVDAVLRLVDWRGLFAILAAGAWGLSRNWGTTPLPPIAGLTWVLARTAGRSRSRAHRYGRPSGPGAADRPPRRDQRICRNLAMRRLTRKLAVPSVSGVPTRRPARCRAA